MVIPTRRLLLIALVGVAAVGLTGSIAGAVFVGTVWLACVTLLALVDARFVPAQSQLHWERRHELKLSLGASNPVSLMLTNASHQPARLRVRDAIPELLVPEGEEGGGVCAAGGDWTLMYHVRPVHRGDYTLGPITARYLGALGLSWRQYVDHPEDRVKVYPNLLAVRSYEALARRGRLDEIGLKTARRLGAGTEFERLRDYTADDEFRRINWAATARRHAPIAVECQTERSQNVMLLIDAGRLMSMQVPYPGEMDQTADLFEGMNLTGPREVVPALTKLDHAVNAALLLAYVSQRQGDRSGLLAFSDRVLRFVKPGAGHRQFLALTEVLYDLEPQGTEADYGAALAYLSVHSPRRALAVIFTDIGHEMAAASLLVHVAHINRRHLPLIVTMRDPAVERMASEEVTDSQSVYERAVARNLLDQREITLSRLRQSGALTLDVPADRLSISLINQYLEIKARVLL